MPAELPRLCGVMTCDLDAPGRLHEHFECFAAHPCGQPQNRCLIHDPLPIDDVPLFKSEHLEIDPEQAALLKAELYRHISPASTSGLVAQGQSGPLIRGMSQVRVLPSLQPQRNRKGTTMQTRVTTSASDQTGGPSAYAVNADTGEIIVSGHELFTFQPAAEDSSGAVLTPPNNDVLVRALLQLRALADEARRVAGLCEQELARRAREAGTLTVPTNEFESVSWQGVGPSYSWDALEASGIRKLISDAEAASLFRPAFKPEPEEVPARVDPAIARKLAGKYKGKVAELLDAARTYRSYTLTVKELGGDDKAKPAAGAAGRGRDGAGSVGVGADGGTAESGFGV